MMAVSARAQWADQSVLSDHTWYKIGVVEDGVYRLDGATLQSLGVELGTLDPERIRLFGNVAGALPEANASSRYDDLTEVAIELTGADDGTFDAQDQILFYGQGPVKLSLGTTNTYTYERHPYTDTLYYFLCLDGSAPGLRMSGQSPVEVAQETPAINIFLDCWYHESEEISPFASGRTWYGDMITAQEGYREFRYDMPGFVKSKPVRLTTSILGRCTSSFYYALSLNGEEVVARDSISSIKQYIFGQEKTIDRIFTMDRDGFTLRYTILPSEQQPLLYIDYFMLNFWRELRFEGTALPFRILPSQFSAETARVQVSGLGPEVRCWEVTDPLNPHPQPYQLQDGVGTFGVEGPAERRYQLFTASGIQPVASIRALPCQNLHGLPGADFLIITPRLFWDQAEALAAFHREADGLDCQVVDVAQIYNEFGTGTPDPTAVRDFIRMVYLRSNQQLRYVLLFGKGTHDYRDIKGQGNNFVPTYEVLEMPWHEVYSVCSDDYFALMGLNEGATCNGKVDLGVGRLPVTTPEQAQDMVNKIRHYADRSATHGPWLNQHLFLADNDQRTYIDYVEYLDRMLDTACPTTTSQKLYVDSYPVVTTPSGARIPEAHEVLMDYLEKGIGVLSYTGHGGVKGLMAELVLTNSDILALRNYDCLPFVQTATCEFSLFDNPNVVSAGELMILNPQGGAAAMLTTVRPTFQNHNQSMSKSFHEHVYDLEDGQRLRFGDIVQRAKADSKYYLKSNISFVLFGDPALRFAYPSAEVRTSLINGAHALSAEVTAGNTVELEGYVSSYTDRIDTLFNGEVEVRLYDKKTSFTTLGAHHDPKDYAYYHDVLFEGRASVTKGRFRITVPIPSEVNYEEGVARVSYYAYDSIRKVHASGVYSQLRVLAGTVHQDQQGPQMTLYWDDPSFVSGEVVSRSGHLCADLLDEQGIYHYNASIGRNIVLRSDVSAYDNLILNDWFVPALDDYRKGRVIFPIEDLKPGSHEFTLKAWDTQGNATEKTITLVIEDGVMLAQVRTIPNPFSDEVYFSFRHGDMSEALRVRIAVYDFLGRQVAALETDTRSSAGTVPPIYWNGSGSNGIQLHSGLYLYRLTIEDEQGKIRSTTGRMVKR